MSVRIQGLRQLQRKLDGLVDAVQRKDLEHALLEAAEPIREVARAKAPRGETGRLSDEMGKAVVESKRNNVAVAVGPSRDAWYGLFQELGTEHHGAQPFLRPAYDERKGEAIEIARQKLGVVIEREARR